jgi:hypothetical protein
LLFWSLSILTCISVLVIAAAFVDFGSGSACIFYTTVSLYPILKQEKKEKNQSNYSWLG